MAAAYDILPTYPDGRDRIPAALRPLQAFVNTVDREHGIDGLSTPAALAALLDDFGLAHGARVGRRDLAAAVEVREALRSLFVVRAGGDAPGGWPEVLAAAGERARLTVDASAGAPRLRAAAGGADGGLGMLLAALAAAEADGSLRRLKACREHRCHWLFWDASPPAAGIWCSMAICGNRTKVRRHRAARRAA